MNLNFKSVLISIIILISTFMSSSAISPNKPDFAFPKTVSEQSEKQLTIAIENHNFQAIVRSLMDYYLSQTVIDSDNSSAALAKINEICQSETDSTLKAVLYLLQANIYNSLYSANRWKYDERSLPLTPLPDDYKLWSGEQFRNKIISLIELSLSNVNPLKSIPLKDYESVITSNKETYIYYPTLYDFIATNSIDLLSAMSSYNRVLSWGLLVPSNLYIVSPFPKSDPIVAKILGLYASLLKANEGRTPAEINTDIRRIDFIYNRVYLPDVEYDDFGQAPKNDPETRLFALLRSLYEENKKSEFSGDILAFMGDNCSDTDPKWLYSSIDYNLKKFPNFWRNNCLKNINKRLSIKEATIHCPMVAPPARPSLIEIEIKNINKLQLEIYEVASHILENRYDLSKDKNLRPIDTIEIELPGDVPFSDKTNVQYSFPHVGKFIVVPRVNGKRESDYYTKVHVTHFALATSRLQSTNLVVIDAASGAPVSDAKVSIIENNRNNLQEKITPVGMTNTDGMITATKRGNYITEKNGDRYALPTYVYINYDQNNNERWTRQMAGYTALPLYHPGDTVEWTAVIYEFNNNRQKLCSDSNVLAQLYDASYQHIDSISTTTDKFGRINGKFVIPKDCLTGNFRIEIDNIGNINFDVSDYKLPTFQVTLDPVEKNSPNLGDVTIRGKVMTYSGFPLADTKISADISVTERLRWWWGRSNGISFASEETITGSDGRFEFTVDSVTLATAPIPQGVFSVQISALSSSGETQSASTTFMTGTKYQIQVALPEAVDVSGKHVAINAKVVNYMDSIIEMPITYDVMLDSVTVLSGLMHSNNHTIDLSSLKSGKYNFRFCLEDKELANIVSKSTVLYRNTDKTTPKPDALLWSPIKDVTADEKGNGKWLYATNCDTYFLLTLWGNDSILSQKWEMISVGMNYLDIKLPEGIDEAKLTIACTGNYRSAEETITVKRDVTRKGIKFITESFRDRILPGSEETWKFKVVDESGNSKQAAVILDMYNTALDALAKTNWNLQFSKYSGRQYSWSNDELMNSIQDSYQFGTYRYANCSNIQGLKFDTYGMGFNATGRSRIYYSRSMSNMKMAKADDLEEVEECASEVTADYAAPAGGMLESSVVTADGGTAIDGATDVPSLKAESKFKYRDAETPLAFFAPQLVTEPDGSLSFTFTAPNANTTWGFNALAYTDSLLSTNFSAKVLANKPIMVQPNLPRFLRSGDRAIISTMVMNNSAETKTVKTIVELFNPNDRSIIKTVESIDTISPNASAIVECNIDAPSETPFIGYRVKSSTSEFADGEQTLISVLPATTPVIETHPFYISPDSTEFNMRLPKSPYDAKITLQYCDNPTWYVVTALPGLLQLNPSTANEAGASIFSAAIAEGLLGDNPTIAEALKEWQNSDKSDGTLTSMLQRNDDLKIILLSATPWMLDAKSDTERMTRLALLFDKNTIKEAYTKSIGLLSRLIRDGGGWAWYTNSKESSEWATENVLGMMGKLYSLNYLPSNKELKSMIINALSYIDNETTKRFRKFPKSDFTYYVYMRDMFKGFTSSSGATDVINNTVQRIVKDWKKASIFDKAIYAKILVNHRYPTMAKTILDSLRQYAKSTPEKGMWWPSLDNMTIWSMGKVGTTSLILEAFAAVEPGCRDIDLIRQWLILQKEAMDWDTSVTTSEVIASILTTSKSWIAPTAPASVFVNDIELKLKSVEQITGYFRTPLTDMSTVNDNSLHVEKTGKSPSWGAIFYQYIDSISNVKAASCDAVAVEKNIYLVEQNNNGSVTVNSSNLSVGDRVKVQLIIRASRDMEYVTITDDRPACYEPVEQLPKPIFSEGIYFYRENRDSSTKFFIDYLPKGTYLLTYDMWVNNPGHFASGIATIQSQYAPQLTAHSTGNTINISK
ncbi:MAG: hypothetical protein NC453_00990 [Muribaculum sp.]|nr:hypothetical protein [Muribaculum sp.]